MNIFWLITIIVIYLGVIAYLGYLGYKNTTSLSDYMVGGRDTHPFIMALSYGATFISTSAIVGFGGVASQFGMSLIWLVFCNIFLGIFIAFLFLGKRTRRMGVNMKAHTFPEFLGKRFNSNFIQWFSGSIIFLFMPVYTAAVLIGASRIMESLLHVPYEYSVAIFSVIVASYVIMGGLKGMMYNDALQGSLMFGGMLILLIFIYTKLGGVTSAHTQLAQLSDKVANNPVVQKLATDGHQGWMSYPKAGSKLWWVIFSSLTLGVGVGVLSQPQLIVRFMTVKSNKELNRAVFIGALFLFVTVGTPYVLGALSNVYFHNEFGKIAIDMAGGNPDKVIPIFIEKAMPTWFSYLFMLVILSAAMSTLSALFHAIGTSAGRDIYQVLFPKVKKSPMLVTKVCIVFSIILTVFLSLRLGAGIIAKATAIFYGITASCFLAPYVCSLFWKKVTRYGAIAGTVSGIVISLFMFLFTLESTAAVFGVCQMLTGKTVLFEVLRYVDPVVFGLPVSALLTVVVSFFTKVKSEEYIAECFKGIEN